MARSVLVVGISRETDVLGEEADESADLIVGVIATVRSPERGPMKTPAVAGVELAHGCRIGFT